MVQHHGQEDDELGTRALVGERAVIEVDGVVAQDHVQARGLGPDLLADVLQFIEVSRYGMVVDEPGPEDEAEYRSAAIEVAGGFGGQAES